MKMNKMDEQVLVVERDWLFDREMLTFQGLMTGKRLINTYMIKMRAFFEARRGDAEDNLNWKQMIPYTVIQRGDEVFLYERLKAGGEERLHNQLSIGIGGHMNNLDEIGDWKQNLYLNLERELHEELNIDKSVVGVPKIIGLINDDSDEVGQVHFGILMLIQLPEGSEVTVKETDQLDGYWVRIKDLTKPPLNARLENWSKLASEIL